jgi:outer membrane immunogenic protein
MVRLSILAAASLGLAIVLPAYAADMPLKAPPIQPPPPNWTGFYLGAQVGGGWGERTVTYAGNDLAAATLINGGLAIGGVQPVASHGVSLSGVTGGIEAGYNWQIGRNWLIGLEADFSGSGVKGTGTGTSALAPPVFIQTVTSEQKLEWWGTVRGRLGWLATDDLLLFGTGGFAYGRVSESDSYIFTGPPGGAIVFTSGVGGPSFSCVSNATCFSGSNSQVKFGWTAGAGGEWRMASKWTLKGEYLYVNLGNASVNSSALAVFVPGAPSSYNANFGRADFHVARVGLNFHF